MKLRYFLHLHLGSLPQHEFVSMQDAADLMVKESKFAEAILLYRNAEMYCRLAIQHGDMDHEQECDVQQKHSLCLLNRSLCHFNLAQYEDSCKCCEQVFGDKISARRIKLKALIRMGCCYAKMAANTAERKKRFLESAQECAAVAEKRMADDPSLPQELMLSVKLLRTEISAIFARDPKATAAQGDTARKKFLEFQAFIAAGNVRPLACSA
jgi:hypothetical protein